MEPLVLNPIAPMVRGTYTFWIYLYLYLYGFYILIIRALRWIHCLDPARALGGKSSKTPLERIIASFPGTHQGISLVCRGFARTYQGGILRVYEEYVWVMEGIEIRGLF